MSIKLVTVDIVAEYMSRQSSNTFLLCPTHRYGVSTYEKVLAYSDLGYVKYSLPYKLQGFMYLTYPYLFFSISKPSWIHVVPVRTDRGAPDVGRILKCSSNLFVNILCRLKGAGTN